MLRNNKLWPSSYIKCRGAHVRTRKFLVSESKIAGVRKRDLSKEGIAHSSSSGWSKRKFAANSSFLSQAKYA